MMWPVPQTSLTRADVVMSYERIENDDTCDSKLSITKTVCLGICHEGQSHKTVLQREDKRIFPYGLYPRHYGWEDYFQPVEEELPL